MQFVDKILFQIDTEIRKNSINDCTGIDSALYTMRFIRPLCDELKKYSLRIKQIKTTSRQFWTFRELKS